MTCHPRCRLGLAFLATLGFAMFLSLTLDSQSASADDDDRYEYRSGYWDDDDRDDDDRYEYRSGYRDDDDRDDDDRYEYRSGYRDDDDRDDDDRYEYRSGYRDDDDRDDDDRYEYRSGYRDNDDRKQHGAGGSSAGASLYSFDDWGIWAVRQDDAKQSLLFAASMFRVGPYFFPAVVGTPSGTNPLQGSAVWQGDVLSFEVDPNAPPVKGDARLKVDFGNATLDVDLTHLTRGHGSLTWRNLALVEGAFRHRDSSGSIDGAFYGDHHQAAAGHFEGNALRGVFGALRQ